MEYQNIQLDKDWDFISKNFNIDNTLLGQGSYGTVVKAQHITSGQIFAIKQVRGIFDRSFSTKMILREIQIMRQLTQMNNNYFTTKLLDIIVPVSEERHLSEFNSIFLIMDFVSFDLH